MMNKTRLFSITIMIFSLTVANVYSQRKEIEQKEYEKLMGEIRENTGKYSYRTINVKNLFRQDGITIQQTERNVTEIVPSGNRRFLSEIVNHVINRTSITELIKIDGKEYRKINGDDWQVVSSKTVLGSEDVKVDNKYKKYHLTKNVLLDGETVDIIEFEMEDTLKYKNHSNNEIIETHNSKWKWTVKDGLFIRSEGLSEKVNPKITISKSITNYEYDPNIKIEAPIK